MASAQVVETSVTNNSPSQDSNHPDDLFQSRSVSSVGCVKEHCCDWFSVLISHSVRRPGNISLERLRNDFPLPGGELNPGLPRDRRGYSPLYYRGSSQIESLPMRLSKSVRKHVWNASWNLQLWAIYVCHRSNESDEEVRLRWGRQSHQRSLFPLPCALSYYFKVSIQDQNWNLWLVNTSRLVSGVKTWQEQWHGYG